MTIIHFYPNFNNIGGAQSMVISIFEGMKVESRNVKICGFTSYDNIHNRYKGKISQTEYIQFSFFNLKTYKSSILISHHRKITTYLEIIKRGFLTKFNLIHIAHNEFFDLKKLSIFPNKIIAVSNKVKQNLIDEFNIDEKNINVIYNGIESESYDRNSKILNLKDTIQILYPARVNKVKQQLELVAKIKEAQINNICITFCGDGELLDELKNQTANDVRFKVKGLIDNMKEEFLSHHFTMLYTKNEGLPVSLIESCNFGVPIICNDVGGNLEIVTHNVNGFVVNSYIEFFKVLEKIKRLDNSQYNILCDNSKDIFINKFTQKKMITQYLNFIDEVF